MATYTNPVMPNGGSGVDGSVNIHGKVVGIQSKKPQSTKGNVNTHGKTAPVKHRTTGKKLA